MEEKLEHVDNPILQRLGVEHSENISAIGFIVSANTKAPNTYKVRIPALHGWCDLNGENCQKPHWKNEDLPFISVVPDLDAPNGSIGGNTPKLAQGDHVLIKFHQKDYKDPYIVGKVKPHPTLGDGEEANQGDLLGPELVLEKFGAYRVDDPERGDCGIVLTSSATQVENGKNTPGADKCGTGSLMKNDITANIADFMKIIQDTDGKIGSKFINKYTGELFSILNYVKKYTSSILGVIRSSIAWIKAQVTKYVKLAIDKLVKAIMKPIQGITKIVDETLEKALNQIACSFGGIEQIIQNLIEDLLNSLVDSALSVVYGCLDTLIDGILNEILSEVTSLINTIIGGISSIAGLIGGFGDLIGEAIASILDFLGISCGGAGDCTASGEKSLVYKFNSPGEYGIPKSVFDTLNGGLDAIDSVSQGIVNGKNGTSAALAKGKEYAAGVELGSSKFPGVSTDNKMLRNAFATAEGLLTTQTKDIFDFCSTNKENQTTNAVVIGTPNSNATSKYDSDYILIAEGNSISSGASQAFTIRRNNTLGPGIINFIAYKDAGDTVRISSDNVTGDFGREIQLSSTDFGEEPYGRNYPGSGSIFYSKKLVFSAGQSEKTVVLSSNKKSPINDTTSEVTYTAAIYRSSDDFTNTYIGDHLPNTSTELNTARCSVLFDITPVVLDPTTPGTPPAISTSYITYSTNNVYVTEGEDAILTIDRDPGDNEKTSIKIITEDGNALGGVNYLSTYPAPYGNVIEFDPDTGSGYGVVYKIPTYDTGLSMPKQFIVKIVDEHLPEGTTSSFGGTGIRDSNGNLTTINQVENIYTVTIYPASFNITPGTNNPCEPEILISQQPPSCILHPEEDILKIGFIAEASVPNYTLQYQWQKTYVIADGWNDIFDGAYSEVVDVDETTYGPLITGTTTLGNPVTISGWQSNIVQKTATCVYAGATTNELTVNPVNYLINDQEYYRCLITATPTTTDPNTPVLSGVTETVYLGVTASGVYASPVRCSPDLTNGTIVTYSGGAAVEDQDNEPVEPSYCGPYPTIIASGVPDIIVNQPPDEIVEDPEFPSQNEDEPGNVVTDDPIVPVPEPETEFPIIPVVVGPGGGVVSIPNPNNGISYSFPPLVSITGPGVGATAYADLDDNGLLTNIIVKSPGFGYSESDDSKKKCGILDSIELQRPGGYYTSSPTVYINGDSSIASAAIDDNGRVVEIRITNPQNKVFDKIPSISIVGGSGLGAAAIAVIRYVDCDTVSDEYIRVVNKYSNSRIGTVRVVDCP